MKRSTPHQLLLTAMLALALIGGHFSLAIAGGPRVEPFNALPAGQSYGRWAAEWWQWVLGIPAAVNPLTDTTGAQCAQRQVDTVWFLAGSASGPVVRSCTIPAGVSLFFPLINTFFGAFL